VATVDLEQGMKLSGQTSDFHSQLNESLPACTARASNKIDQNVQNANPVERKSFGNSDLFPEKNWADATGSWSTKTI
jgi:hypothetical protein